MPIEQLSSLIRETFWTSLLVVSPVLIAAMVVGLMISIVQSATQLNEMTLTFVPKIVTVLGLFALLFPWMMRTIGDFGSRIFEQIAQRGGP